MDLLVILSFVTIKYCHINNIYKYVNTHIYINDVTATTIDSKLLNYGSHVNNYKKKINVKITNIRSTLNNMITEGLLYRYNYYYGLTYKGNKIYNFIVNRCANKIINFFRNQKRSNLKLYYNNI